MCFNTKKLHGEQAFCREQTLCFYGRRRGRRLRPQSTDNLNWGLARFGIDSDWLTQSDAVDLARLFAGSINDDKNPTGTTHGIMHSDEINTNSDENKNPTGGVLEIGFGGGEHLAGLAQANPHTRFIGAEPFVNGVASLCGHIRREHLTNIRILPDDVRLLLPKLPDACLDGVFILFPDPWPKHRHRGRRILQPWLVADLVRLIRIDGQLVLASDDSIAKAWILQSLLHCPQFEWQAQRPNDWLKPPSRAENSQDTLTRYGTKAERAGRPIAWFIYKRI